MPSQIANRIIMKIFFFFSLLLLLLQKVKGVGGVYKVLYSVHSFET